MKTRRRRSSSSNPAVHFSYGDPRDGGSLPGRRKITFWQAFVFVLVLVGLIGLAALVFTNQPTEQEIKRAYNAGP